MILLVDSESPDQTVHLQSDLGLLCPLITQCGAHMKATSVIRLDTCEIMLSCSQLFKGNGYTFRGGNSDKLICLPSESSLL